MGGERSCLHHHSRGAAAHGGTVLHGEAACWRYESRVIRRCRISAGPEHEPGLGGCARRGYRGDLRADATASRQGLPEIAELVRGPADVETAAIDRPRAGGRVEDLAAGRRRAADVRRVPSGRRVVGPHDPGGVRGDSAHGGHAGLDDVLALTGTGVGEYGVAVRVSRRSPGRASVRSAYDTEVDRDVRQPCGAAAIEQCRGFARLAAGDLTGRRRSELERGIGGAGGTDRPPLDGLVVAQASARVYAAGVQHVRGVGQRGRHAADGDRNGRRHRDRRARAGVAAGVEVVIAGVVGRRVLGEDHALAGRHRK